MGSPAWHQPLAGDEPLLVCDVAFMPVLLGDAVYANQPIRHQGAQAQAGGLGQHLLNRLLGHHRRAKYLHR